MVMLVAAVFWIALGVTVYNLLVYPWLLRRLSRWRTDYAVGNRMGDSDGGDRSLLSIILPTAGYEKTVLDRLQNLLEMDYPADRFEIVVGCDGRDSLIYDLVNTMNDPRIRAVHSSTPRESHGVINDCLARARGDIVVLTDCGVKFERGLLGRIAAQFRSPHVGAVCGRLATTISSADGNRSYTNCRDSFMADEARFGVVPESAEKISAYRAELLRSVPERASEAGLFAGLAVYHSGQAIVFDAEAVASVRSTMDPASDHHQSIRSGIWKQTLSVFAMMRVAGVSLASFVLLSRLLRRQTSIFVGAAMISNAILAGDPFFLRLLLLQEFAYLVVLGRLCIGEGKRWPYWGSAARPQRL